MKKEKDSAEPSRASTPVKGARPPSKASSDKENVAPVPANTIGKPAAHKAGAPPELYPVVEFVTTKGKRTMTVAREEFRHEGNDGTLLARRLQVSCRRLFAVTFH